ncbi:MAG: hypothetical protein DRP64_08965, partial [Verrucomicrobia bacterium]
MRIKIGNNRWGGLSINTCGHPERRHHVHNKCQQCAMRAYKSTPERKAHFAAYQRGYMKEYMTRPGKRDAERARARERAKTKEWREYHRAYGREYAHKPEQVAKRRAHARLPEVVRKRRIRLAEWRERPEVRARAQYRYGLGASPSIKALGDRVGWVCGHALTGGCRAARRVIDPTLPGSHPLGATFEHIVPVSEGGTNDPHNL